MLSVVTSFGPAGWDLYGRRFVDCFHEHWPLSARLIVYWEGERPDYPGDMDGFDLLKVPPAAAFLDKWRTNPMVHGKLESSVSPWSGKARRIGYCFRHDAYKFARKVFAVADAARLLRDGRLFWVDADVVTRKRIPDGLFDSLLPDTISLCYLKRRTLHSELGFVGYNLNRREARDFINAYEHRYSSDAFLTDAAWDDCNQFDALVARLSPSVNWIPHNSVAQPFDGSILGRYMRHNKGKRKDA